MYKTIFSQVTNRENIIRKLLFIFFITFILRIGNGLLLPYINYSLLPNDKYINIPQINLFTLGIYPYINSSIFIQILTPLIPYLNNLKKEEGELGREEYFRIIKIVSLILAIFQAFKLILSLQAYVFYWNFFVIFKLISILVSGSLITIWLSDLITETRLGNGTSILICINILEQIKFIPVLKTFYFTSAENLIVFFLFFFLLVSGIILLESTVKEIKLIPSKQFITKNIVEEEYSIPFKFLPSGVMPIVYASTVRRFLEIFIQNQNIKLISPNFLNILSNLLNIILIIFFSYTSSSISIDIKNLTEELKKDSIIIPNIRPGKPTYRYILYTLNRIYILGGICLGCLVTLFSIGSIFLKELNISSFTVSSIFIVVGTFLEIFLKIKDLEDEKNFSIINKLKK